MCMYLDSRHHSKTFGESTMGNLDLAVQIKDAALNCGFDVCGIVKVEEMKDYAAAIDSRIAHFPEAKPMYARFADFADPTKMVPWAKSVIVYGHWYGNYRVPENVQGRIGKALFFDPRKNPYSKENQNVLRFEKILTGLDIKHVAKHDSGISAMRWAAAKSGIGIIRKNNFFYTERGSWFNLGIILIDRELELKAASSIKSCPENCSLCIKSCPTEALREPFQMNGIACAAFLTCMGTCAPSKNNYDKCGSWIFGCDACQDVCPFNEKAWNAVEDFPGLEKLAGLLSYEQILSMDYETMTTVFPQKFWYIQPDDVWKWKCNVLNAMRNNYDSSYLPYIKHALSDSKAEVREMAKYVFESVTVIV